MGQDVPKSAFERGNRRGEFEPDSSFEGEVRDYFANQVDFVSLSRQCAQFIAEELGHMESPESCDVLVADFEDDAPKVSADTPEEDQEAAYEAQGKRYFVVALLNSRPAFMHEVGGGELGTRVDIARHHAILPNPSQKLSSYALVESKTLEVLFCDKEREISGEKRLLLPEGLLQCSSEASSKEVVDTVTRIVEEVAQGIRREHGCSRVEGKGLRTKTPTIRRILRRGTWPKRCSTTSLCRSVLKKRSQPKICPTRYLWRRRRRSVWLATTKFVPIRALKSLSLRSTSQPRFHRVCEHAERHDFDRAEEYRKHWRTGNTLA